MIPDPRYYLKNNNAFRKPVCNINNNIISFDVPVQHALRNKK